MSTVRRKSRLLITRLDISPSANRNASDMNGENACSMTVTVAKPMTLEAREMELLRKSKIFVRESEKRAGELTIFFVFIQFALVHPIHLLHAIASPPSTFAFFLLVPIMNQPALTPTQSESRNVDSSFIASEFCWKFC